jgi:NitT/TauT family transport system permease protein
MSILISIILSTQNILNGFKNTNKNKIKLLKTLNAPKKDIITKLVIPSNRQTIINSLKINISMCLIGTIQGEFLTSKSGIGYLIMYGTQVFNLNLVMTGIILLTIISYIMYLIVNKLK